MSHHSSADLFSRQLTKILKLVMMFSCKNKSKLCFVNAMQGKEAEMSEHKEVRQAIVWQCLHCKRYFEGKDERQSQELAASCHAQCQQALDIVVIKTGMNVKTVRTEEDILYVVLSRRVCVGNGRNNRRSVICRCQWEDEDGETRTREFQMHVLLPVTGAV